MNSNKISVITCSMNRGDHLKDVVKSTNEIVNLHEHLIIDFSSDKEKYLLHQCFDNTLLFEHPD